MTKPGDDSARVIAEQRRLIDTLQGTIRHLSERNDVLEHRCDCMGTELHEARVQHANQESRLKRQLDHLKSLYISLNNKFQDQLRLTERLHTECSRWSPRKRSRVDCLEVEETDRYSPDGSERPIPHVPSDQ